MHCKFWCTGSVLWKAWWWLNRVETCCHKNILCNELFCLTESYTLYVQIYLFHCPITMSDHQRRWNHNNITDVKQSSRRIRDIGLKLIISHVWFITGKLLVQTVVQTVVPLIKMFMISLKSYRHITIKYFNISKTAFLHFFQKLPLTS